MIHPTKRKQLEDAARLKRLFCEKARLSQASFGAEYKIGSQGYVWQLLNGRRPLSLMAAQRFSKGLGVPIDAFSPDLAKQVALANTQIEHAAGDKNYVFVRFVDTTASETIGKIVFADNSSSPLRFRRTWLEKSGAHPDETFAFRISGVSIRDLQTADDVVLLVDHQKKEPVSGHTYVVWTYGRLRIKQLVARSDRWITPTRNLAETDHPLGTQPDLNETVVGQVFWCGFNL